MSENLVQLIPRLHNCSTLKFCWIKTEDAGILREFSNAYVSSNYYRKSQFRSIELSDIFCLDFVLENLGMNFLYIFEEIHLNGSFSRNFYERLDPVYLDPFPKLKRLDIHLRDDTKPQYIFQKFPGLRKTPLCHFRLFSCTISNDFFENMPFLENLESLFLEDIFFEDEDVGGELLQNRFIEYCTRSNSLITFYIQEFHCEITASFLKLTNITFSQNLKSLSIVDQAMFNEKSFCHLLDNISTSSISELAVSRCPILSDSLSIILMHSSKFKNLEKLDFSYCWLWTCSSSKLSESASLHLSNFISALHVFPNLRHLDLSQNRIGTLPLVFPDLCNLLSNANLSYLSLAHNLLPVELLSKLALQTSTRTTFLTLDMSGLHLPANLLWGIHVQQVSSRQIHSSDSMSSTSWGEYLHEIDCQSQNQEAV
jgi:hypothetical protein